LIGQDVVGDKLKGIFPFLWIGHDVCPAMDDSAAIVAAAVERRKGEDQSVHMGGRNADRMTWPFVLVLLGQFGLGTLEESRCHPTVEIDCRRGQFSARWGRV